MFLNLKCRKLLLNNVLDCRLRCSSNGVALSLGHGGIAFLRPPKNVLQHRRTIVFLEAKPLEETHITHNIIRQNLVFDKHNLQNDEHTPGAEVYQKLKKNKSCKSKKIVTTFFVKRCAVL